MGPQRRKGWCGPCRPSAGLDPRGAYDEPSLDYRHYLDAFHRVKPSAFSRHKPSDEDLALLVLCSLDRERHRRAKEFKFDGLPSCTIVRGTLYFGDSTPLGDSVENVLYYGLREDLDDPACGQAVAAPADPHAHRGPVELSEALMLLAGKRTPDKVTQSRYLKALDSEDMASARHVINTYDLRA